MTDEKMHDGGPAFPQDAAVTRAFDLYEDEVRGMSLRDWFAGQALAGDLADGSYPLKLGEDSADAAARRAYRFADAMLKVRGG